METASQRPLSSRIAGQGALLFSGFALAQALSFVRNALLAHLLSKGDFGVAAAILLLLQTIETLSDLGADRLIVQDRDGDDARFVANAHMALVVRGIVTAVIIAALALPIARLFAIEHAAWAFATIALSPAIKGFLHLDSRRVQRHLDNRPQMLIEVAPQAVALALAWPAVQLLGGYAAVVAISLAQAIIAVTASHVMAQRRYAIAIDRATMSKFMTFGWPIWASAFPLVAVYHGDRILIGHLAGIESLAAYTVAFMVTMVPGLVAAKVANALMLPLLAGARDEPARFTARLLLMIEATVLASALYLALFVIAGDPVVTFAFGAAYSGLGTVVALLAMMWSMRMLQATMGVALMAVGETRPFLAAGLIRAIGLPLAGAALLLGYGLAGAAAGGVIAEFMSLVYVAWCMQGRLPQRSELGTGTLKRATFIAAAGVAALMLELALAPVGLGSSLAVATAASVATTSTAAMLMPAIRNAIVDRLASRGAALPSG